MKKPWLKKLTSSASKRLRFAAGLAAVITLALQFAVVSAHAFEKSFTVKVRDGKKLITEERMLTDLTSETAFEGSYFKVVKASSSDAIRFDDEDRDVVMRAATVYYHMSATREYFDGLALPDESGLRKQMVIRIDQEQNLSEVFHFDPRPEMNQYNASKIIPPSDPFMLAKDVQPWGYEIWFRKAKTIKRNSPLTYLSLQINSRDFKTMLMGQLLYTDMVSMTQSAVMGYFNPMDHLISMAFSIGLSELIPQTLGLVGKFAKQRYYLDSAMIPEIAIHEFSHIALSPVFGLKKSTALNEGFANYFAHKVTGLKKLGARARKHNLSDAPKSALNRAKYSFDQEMLKQAAYGSFTFSLLYELDQALGTEGEKILTRSLFYLQEDSNLKAGLTDAVRRAINDVGTNKKAQWYEALAVFTNRGL